MNQSRVWLSRLAQLGLLLSLVELPHLPPVPLIAGALALRVARGARRRWTRGCERQGELAGGELLLGHLPSGRAVGLSSEQISAHGLILGASGSGKSTTLLRILCDRITQGHPVVAIDMKGSPAFALRLQEAAAAAGRPLLVWTPEGSAWWNPLGHGGPTELKDKLIASERFTEPHYQRAAERYLQLAFTVLREREAAGPPTLEEVVELLDPPRLLLAARHLRPARRAALHDYVEGLTGDQLSAVRGLATRLAILTESEVGGLLAAPREFSRPLPEIDLAAALDGEQVVLFSLNSGRMGKLAAQLGTLAVQDLVAAAGRRLSAPGPAGRSAQAVVAIDEFSALEGAQVLSLLARAREAGVSVIVATQELADLDRAAPGLRDQVLGNTALKIAHRQDVPASAQAIAQMAGTEKRWEVTHTLPPGPLSLALSPRAVPRSGGSRREVEQFLVHPNQIKRLRTGEAVVISKVPSSSVQKVRVAPPGAARRTPAQAAARRTPGQAPAPGVTR